jgi:anaerobic selenocysteine-containing dehydrogenase
LITGPRTRAFVNSQFRHIPSIAAKMPEPYVEIHPSAAAAAGIVDGKPVAVISARGRLEMLARVTDRVHPRAVVVPAGWAQANANLLTDAKALDPISGFPAFRGGACRVEPA